MGSNAQNFHGRQGQSLVRRVSASLDNHAIALCHEHACSSLEAVADLAEELAAGEGANSAASAALAREVRAELQHRIAAQLSASARPAVRRAATVAVLRLAEYFGPLDLVDWLWTAEQLLPPLALLARKETDAAATAELILLTAALGGAAGVAFVGLVASRAADCAQGRGPWRRFMGGASGERQAAWLMHRVLELCHEGTLGNSALASVLRQAETIARAAGFCAQSGSEPDTRDMAERSLGLLQQLLNPTHDNDMEQRDSFGTPLASKLPQPCHPSPATQRVTCVSTTPHTPLITNLKRSGINRLSSADRQARELLTMAAALRQAVRPSCGRTLYGRPVESWQSVFDAIILTENGPVFPVVFPYEWIFRLCLQVFRP